eukprot:CAMPEP_0119051568 /NCGR_PEP_ID=MMETSP1177-20130426/73141_1 /TAXON_ID=2985 /ORGANISM="Ochromonas sp, Strain CCMP1899" /LENGTH=30 /DNA_ID= /DNA_START= /DNA_END= /DNA_ORIENTATION=
MPSQMSSVRKKYASKWYPVELLVSSSNEFD